LFTKTKEESKILIVSLYVDDLIYTENDMNMCAEFKNSMIVEFYMFDLGRMQYFLGVEVIQNPNGIFVCQRRYAREVLVRFGMNNSNSVHNHIMPRTMTFSLFLNFIVCFCMWSEHDKLYYFKADSDIPSEDDKLSQSLQLLTSPSDSSFL
jgi:hypothetical protein